MIAFYLAAAVVAGALITLQTGSNARLKEALGDAIPAAIISSALGIPRPRSRASLCARSCSTTSG
jgi:uncharacterized membrane protein YdcZ (DUF606 family)